MPKFFTLRSFNPLLQSPYVLKSIWTEAVAVAEKNHPKIPLNSTDEENVAFLNHLWYLSGENDLIDRRNRGGGTDLRELHGLEAQVKRRLMYFLTHVLYFHSERIEFDKRFIS